MNRSDKPIKVIFSIDTEATGARIKQLAEDRGISINDIVYVTGVMSRQAVYKWYTGASLPSLENMLALRHLFGLQSIEELMVIRSDTVI